nr:60S ribosomal protein L18-2 [Tanacetum cinerariifolium]
MVSVQELNIEGIRKMMRKEVKRSRDAVLDRPDYTANESCRAYADRDVEHSSSKGLAGRLECQVCSIRAQMQHCSYRESLSSTSDKLLKKVLQ